MKGEKKFTFTDYWVFNKKINIFHIEMTDDNYKTGLTETETTGFFLYQKIIEMQKEIDLLKAKD